MIRHIEISLENQHGALLRILGTIERRGWVVRAMDMNSQGNDAQTLRLKIERSRHHSGSFETLTRHVTKLFCVRQIGVSTTQTDECAIVETSTSPHAHMAAVATGAPA